MFAGSRFEKGSLALLAILVVLFIYAFVDQSGSLALLLFEPSQFLVRPWTVLTYNFLTGGGANGFISCLFAGLWLFQVGSRIERDLGLAKYLGFVLGLSALSAVFVWLGWMATQTPGYAAGPYFMLAVITVLWGSRYPNEEVRFWGCIPIKAKWIAWISAGLVFFGSPPALALFAAAPLALAWAYAANKLPVRYGKDFTTQKEKVVVKNFRENDEYFADAHRRSKEREERERLRKLFEGSISEEDDKR